MQFHVSLKAILGSLNIVSFSTNLLPILDTLNALETKVSVPLKTRNLVKHCTSNTSILKIHTNPLFPILEDLHGTPQAACWFKYMNDKKYLKSFCTRLDNRNLQIKFTL